MSTMRSFIKGEVLSREGERGKSFFIIVDGQIGIFKNDVKLAEFNQPGTIVGELSVILKLPRTASIKAITDVNVLIVEGDIDEITKRYPDISKKLIHTLAERLAKTTEHLIH